MRGWQLLVVSVMFAYGLTIGFGVLVTIWLHVTRAMPLRLGIGYSLVLAAFMMFNAGVGAGCLLIDLRRPLPRSNIR